MVIYTSDNGPEKSWQARIKEFEHDSRGQFRGGKRDIYEGGHRVPFLIRWPAGIKQPGRTFDGLVGQIDLLATLAELTSTQLPADAGEDSQSFLSVLSDSNPNHQRLPLINHAANGRFAITEGNWKLVMPHRKLKAELYDLATDQRETKNVIADQAETVRSLTKKITDIVQNGRTTSGPTQANDTGLWSDLTWIKKD